MIERKSHYRPNRDFAFARIACVVAQFRLRVRSCWLLVVGWQAHYDDITISMEQLLNLVARLESARRDNVAVTHHK